MNQITLMLYMGMKSASGRVAPDSSDVCQLSHVCCIFEQAGQAAHKALTRYSSWSSRLRNGRKQGQEQRSAAWAWHHEWRNFAGAALFVSPSLEQPFASLIIKTIANITHKLHWHACTWGHMHAPVVLPHAFTGWCGCAMGTSTGPKQAVARVIIPVMSVSNPSR